MSESIPASRTSLSAQLGAGALQPVLGGCRMSPPLPWLGQPAARPFPASRCSPRPRDGGVTLPRRGCSVAAPSLPFGVRQPWPQPALGTACAAAGVTCSEEETRASRFPLFILYAPLVTVNGTGSHIWAFISLAVFFLPPLCISAQRSAVGVTDKCNSPVLAEVLGHGWAPTGPQGLWWHRGSWGWSRGWGQPGQWFWGPQWGPGWWQMS